MKPSLIYLDAAMAAFGAWLLFGRIGAGLVLLLAVVIFVLARMPFSKVDP